MSSKVLLVLFPSLFLFLTACQPETKVAEEPAVSELASIASTQETEEQTAERLLATFPAQQRAPADPESIARGEIIFGINCRACHGPDLRGGDLGGPNLLRSQLVLNDLDGELIAPVIKSGRNNPGMVVMPPLNLATEDIAAVTDYIHSVVSTSRGQGAPPAGTETKIDIVVGNVAAGREYFNQECSGCHTAAGDMSTFVSQIQDPMNIQDSWVAGRRRGAPNPNTDPTIRDVSVTVTLSTGEKVTGTLGRIDDFLVSLTTPDGQYRSFTLHESTQPGVVQISRNDPMARHRRLLSEYTDDIMHNVTAYLVTLR